MRVPNSYKITFDVNKAKAVEAVLYILNKRPAQTANMYNVFKSLFEADKRHLNNHGRPVTGDTYIRMDFGTVPSLVYDLVKRTPGADLRTDSDDAIPFDRDGNDLIARRNFDPDYLSISDKEALDQGMATYIQLPFKLVERINHEERCWKETQRNKPIAFELIIENPEVLDALKSMPFKLVV